MAMELAAQAKEAFVDDDFDVAVDLYSKAIDLDPSCADFFADRAQAYFKLQNFTGNLLLVQGEHKAENFVLIGVNGFSCL